jgi:hypothetical protein
MSTTACGAKPKPASAINEARSARSVAFMRHCESGESLRFRFSRRCASAWQGLLGVSSYRVVDQYPAGRRHCVRSLTPAARHGSCPGPARHSTVPAARADLTARSPSRLVMVADSICPDTAHPGPIRRMVNAITRTVRCKTDVLPS